MSASKENNGSASRTSLESARRDLLPPLLPGAAKIETDLHATPR
ncbi:hypothetical protein [Herbidospora yilanensis]|nr:hypothetical protein [Herbidospora yilanensis]